MQVNLEDRFNSALIRSIEDTVSTVLGKTVAEAFKRYFYAYLGLTREDIPNHLNELVVSLNRSFGVGGDVLGRAIVRRLCTELDLSLVLKPNSSLVENVADAKKLFFSNNGSDVIGVKQ